MAATVLVIMYRYTIIPGDEKIISSCIISLRSKEVFSRNHLADFSAYLMSTAKPVRDLPQRLGPEGHHCAQGGHRNKLGSIRKGAGEGVDTDVSVCHFTSLSINMSPTLATLSVDVELRYIHG